MSLCSGVPNPCKICLQSVTDRTGIQCKGACRSWVHYECLNYTPGKIRDVEMGIIKVTCPCPDCKSVEPKEYLADQPYACDNIACPANNPPCCDQPDCVANIQTRCRPPLCRQPGSLRVCAPGVCHKYQANRIIQSPCCNDPYANHPERDLCIQFTDATAGDCDNAPEDPTARLIKSMAKEVEDLAAQLNKLRSKMKDDDCFSEDQNSYSKNQDRYSFTTKVTKCIQIQSDHDMLDGGINAICQT